MEAWCRGMLGIKAGETRIQTEGGGDQLSVRVAVFLAPAKTQGFKCVPHRAVGPIALKVYPARRATERCDPLEVALVDIGGLLARVPLKEDGTLLRP